MENSRTSSDFYCPLGYSANKILEIQENFESMPPSIQHGCNNCQSLKEIEPGVYGCPFVSRD